VRNKELKTIKLLVDFFSDGRYMLLLETSSYNRNVRFDEEGNITICFTEDDVKTLQAVPRIYRDLNNLNKEYKFRKHLLLPNFEGNNISKSGGG
jgi:hypothetical protein